MCRDHSGSQEPAKPPCATQLLWRVRPPLQRPSSRQHGSGPALALQAAVFAMRPCSTRLPSRCGVLRDSVMTAQQARLPRCREPRDSVMADVPASQPWPARRSLPRDSVIADAPPLRLAPMDAAPAARLASPPATVPSAAVPSQPQALEQAPLPTAPGSKRPAPAPAARALPGPPPLPGPPALRGTPRLSHARAAPRRRRPFAACSPAAAAQP